MSGGCTWPATNDILTFVDRRKTDPIYDKDGVYRVEQVDHDVDLITLRLAIVGRRAVCYQQILWNRRTLRDHTVRKLTCF